MYRWSSLRSAYVAEANVDAAPSYLGSGGWYGVGWIGSGWYWDPWFSCYTFIPGDGIFYSPFGWDFYSPWWAYRAPIYLDGRYFRYFGPNAYRSGAGAHDRPGIRGGGVSPSPRGGFGGGGFHGGGFGGSHSGVGGHGR